MQKTRYSRIPAASRSLKTGRWLPALGVPRWAPGSVSPCDGNFTELYARER